MRKLILVGSRSETRATMDLLHKSGCAEIAPANEEEGTFRADVSKRADELALKLADIEFAFEFITNCTREAAELSKKKIVEYKKTKKELLAPQPTLTFEEFTACAEKQEQLNGIIGELKQLSSALAECASEKLKCENALSQLMPYAEVAEELGIFAPTEHTYAAIGTISASEFKEGEWSEKCVWRMWSAGSQAAIAVVCHKEDEELVRGALSDMEFSPAPAEYKRTFAQEKADIDKRAEEIASRRAQTVLQVVALDVYEIYILLGDAVECFFPSEHLLYLFFLAGKALPSGNTEKQEQGKHDAEYEEHSAYKLGGTDVEIGMKDYDRREHRHAYGGEFDVLYAEHVRDAPLTHEQEPARDEQPGKHAERDQLDRLHVRAAEQSEYDYGDVERTVLERIRYNGKNHGVQRIYIVAQPHDPGRNEERYEIYPEADVRHINEKIHAYAAYNGGRNESCRIIRTAFRLRQEYQFTRKQLRKQIQIR